MNVENFRHSRFLIIGGTSKAGTTSLYKYLSDHPQVCPSSIKETRFFLDPDYPLPSKTQFSEDLAGYASFFSTSPSSQENVLLEATPDYLYSKNASRIADLLPNARMVFVLRDPVSRLISWFKYSKQRGMLGNSVSIEEYVHMQLDNPVTPTTPIYLRVLEQGKYTKYLSAFHDSMADRMLVLEFSELEESPQRFVKKICDFGEIDAAFYDNYDFTIENVSYAVKYQKISNFYRSLRRKVTYRVHDRKYLVSVLRRLNRPIKSIIRRNAPEDVVISEKTRRELDDYYAICDSE